MQSNYPGTRSHNNWVSTKCHYQKKAKTVRREGCLMMNYEL